MVMVQEVFKIWCMMFVLAWGEVVWQYGLKLCEYKDVFGCFVFYEMGKSLQEGWGEVQEMIDICDFVVGQFCQLYGLMMYFECLSYCMYEQYYLLGIVGIILAFNFLVVVWFWNFMIVFICGDVMVWKVFEKFFLCFVVC